MEYRKVLIVNDTKIDRKILRVIFESPRDKYEIYEAEDVQSASELISEIREFALVLLGLKIVKGDNLQLLMYINELRLQDRVPVIVLLSGNDSVEELQALNLGADEVIHQPFVPEILLRKAENLMRLYDQHVVRKEIRDMDYRFDLDLMNSKAINLFWKDKNRRFIGANQKFLDTYGFSDLSDILGKTDEDMGWHVDEGPFKEDEWRVLDHGEVLVNQIGNCIIQGVAHNILASKEPIYQNGKIIGLMGYFVTIDELQTENGKSASIEIKDKVTGLMSTHGVTAMLTEYAEGWVSRNENFAVIRISVSEYDQATKTAGEKSAKQMLIDMSRMLKDIFGRDGTCARLYAGNFVVLIKCRDKSSVRSFSTLIMERLKKVHTMAGYATTMNPKVHIYFADEVPDLQHMMGLVTGAEI